tara:strand:+ start:3186 stop:4403 length:1218 start_codon:yes stop_codon:yes gene_type:complete
MKILAVNIAFRTEDHYIRWRMLAGNFSNTSVVLVGPKKYVYNQFGKPILFEPEQIDENNFKVSHIDMENKWYLRHSDWWDWELFRIILRERPDLIYLIGYEARNALFISKIATLFLKNRPIVGLFSMRGKDFIFYNIFSKIRWFFAGKWYSFIHVHYPKGKELYEKTLKFNKPICMQTQVGVNTDVYFKSSERRAEIRKKYKIKENDFVFGSAIRIQKSKGVFDILDACEKLNFDFKFLLLGDGADAELVKERIEKSKVLKNRIIWPGRIDGSASVAAHLNAMDAFIHIPHTTESWVDTFPLAVVQAMATRLPVIGSDSGAVPYQLGDEGLVIREGNVDELMGMMVKLFKNKELLTSYGENLYQRVLTSFEIKHLNSCLHQNFKAYLDKENDEVIKDQVKNEKIN